MNKMRNDQQNESRYNRYYDRALLKLRQEYSKDEVVGIFIKKLSEAEIQIGQLKDEIEEMKEEKRIIDRDVTKEAKIQVKKEEMYMDLSNQCKDLKKEIRELTNLRDELLSKLYAQ